MQAVKKLSVIGAGAWGTALAKHLAEKGLDVRLWAYEQDVVDAINRVHQNPMFLKDIHLPPSLNATSSLAEAIHACDGILFVVPSHVTRPVLQKLAGSLSKPVPLISATKGIEEGTAKLMTQVMEEVLGEGATMKAGGVRAAIEAQAGAAVPLRSIEHQSVWIFLPIKL